MLCSVTLPGFVSLQPLRCTFMQHSFRVKARVKARVMIRVRVSAASQAIITIFVII